MNYSKSIIIIACFLLGMITTCHAVEPVKIGSKKFTESVILGEIVSSQLQEKNIPAKHIKELGGTRILWDSLVKGEIDIYPEYTGTLTQEIFAGKNIQSDESLREELKKQGLMMTNSLGFNDTYALGIKESLAQKMGIETISDLQKFPELVFGFSNEFLERKDGWPGLKAKYRLPQKNVTGLDHDLAYRGIQSDKLQLTDLYSTDAEIEYYKLRTLKDDLHYFPQYIAVLVYREDLVKRVPQVASLLQQLEGKIDEPKMIAMNAAAKLNKIPEGKVAAGFLKETFGTKDTFEATNDGALLIKYTLEHLKLVGISLFFAILIAIPLGILSSQKSSLGQVILSTAGIIQTIPSLALLVFMIPLLGIGATPAIVALFLYSLLPIIRNTHQGLEEIPISLRESAIALGLPPAARLRLIELPLSTRAILSGIKTSAVINIGTATLGALIGAGGYGQPILTGIRLDNIHLILLGAVPAAVMALLVQGIFELIERYMVPRGMKTSPTRI